MKEWLTRLTLMSLGFIVSAMTLEFGLSKFAPHPETFPVGLHESDKYIGWKGIPGKEKEWVKRVGKRKSSLICENELSWV